jgi:hypothetical protein
MEFHEKDGAPLIVSEAQVITKATLEAAERLGLSTGDLATVLDVPEDTVSRMERLEHLVRKGTPSFQRALLLIRLFRSVNAVANGDEIMVRAWLHNANAALGGIPAEKIVTPDGMTDVLAALESRHSLPETERGRCSRGVLIT